MTQQRPRETAPEPDAASRDVVQQREETIPEADPEPFEREDDVPEADALDQARTVRPTSRVRPHVIADEVPEADRLDQDREVPIDEDDERRDDR